MKQKLLIIGAGNIGGFIAYNIDIFGDYEVLGFLDDDPGKQNSIQYGRKVLGTVRAIDTFLGTDPVAVVIGIGNPQIKQRIATMLLNKNIFYPNFIAPSVWISKQVVLGSGLILYPGVTINYETVLSDFVIVNMNCAIGHNCTLDEFSTLAPGVNLAGFTQIGVRADVGIGATTIQGIRIGTDSRVGGQTIVLRDVPDHAVVVGNPGRILRYAE